MLDELINNLLILSKDTDKLITALIEGRLSLLKLMSKSIFPASAIYAKSIFASYLLSPSI